MSMTNNDELALKLKAAAEKATKGNWRRASTRFNGITATPFSLSGVERMLARTLEKCDAEFITTASPANILALLAERDADKKRIEMLEKYVNERDAQNQDLLLTIGKLREELEARTVSVKLPDCDYAAVQHMSGGTPITADGTQNAIKCFKADLAAAGIKLDVGE
ncbi:ead/Ea22-like family protein [Kosakonia sp. R1.Fl]|uniref:ead/Ea22-like family protein n=1 Tax=Kosakonia sp. R1.Fl TaxID=2928706 RepID=UPI00201DC455|nr:ead/Ea22-like family protein [Kosakonia sp. R1.Fl]MCL6745084.1 ead/Ea22-like family protein [Kosakonia sp. R1.Fl]